MSRPSRLNKIDPADPKYRNEFHDYVLDCVVVQPGFSVIDTSIYNWLAHQRIRLNTNPYFNANDFYNWTEILAAGRRYFTSNDTTEEEFLKKYTSPLAPWQKLAFKWAITHMDQQISTHGIRGRRRWDWQVSVRNNYVEISLPSHYRGGERYWACQDGKHKILINKD
jgi:hypothetical protein